MESARPRAVLHWAESAWGVPIPQFLEGSEQLRFDRLNWYGGNERLRHNNILTPTQQKDPKTDNQHTEPAHGADALTQREYANDGNQYIAQAQRWIGIAEIDSA